MTDPFEGFKLVSKDHCRGGAHGGIVDAPAEVLCRSGKGPEEAVPLLPKV